MLFKGFQALFPQFAFSPDDAGGAAAAPETPPATTPAAAPAAAPSAAPAASTPSAPRDVAGAAAAGTPATPAAQSRADWLRSLGVQVPQGADDSAAQAHFIRQQQALAQQAQQYQQLAPHLNDFQTYLRQKEAEAQKQKQAEGWKAPEWDPQWRHLIRRDDQGNLTPAPGAPADIVAKYQAWAQHSTNVFDSLAKDPVDYLMKQAGLEQKLQAMIDARFGDNFSKHEHAAKAQAIEQQVASWVYQTDAQGNRVTNPLTGQPEYTAHGQFYLAKLQEASAAGITDPHTKDSYAKGQLALALMQANQQTPAQPTSIAEQNAQAKQSFLQKAATGAAPHPPANQTPPPEQPIEGGARGLQARMEASFRKNGYGDLSKPPAAVR